MIDPMRDLFENMVYPSFDGTSHGLRRKPNGEYVSDVLEDHWQTFQEGWECAIEYLKTKDSEQYSDILSDGGMDLR